MKKNAVLLIVVILLFITIPLGLIGCEMNDEFETDLFVCRYEKNKTEVTILELTKKGANQEILVIPKEINGFPVTGLGGYQRGGFGETFLQGKAKKIYFLAELNFPGGGVLFKNVDIILLCEKKANTISEFKSLNKFYCINSEELKVKFSDEFSSKILPANIFYYLNGDLVWVDAINEDLLYYLPQSYSEKQFYYDEALTEEWNGEYVIPEGQEELNLYAKFEK